MHQVGYEYFHFLFDLKAVDPTYSKTVPIGIAITRRPFSIAKNARVWHIRIQLALYRKGFRLLRSYTQNGSDSPYNGSQIKGS
jgi:hypothetical protein